MKGVLPEVEKDKSPESIYLNEHFMGALCVYVVITSVISFVIIQRTGDWFANFEVIIKLITTVAMYLAFRDFKWDAAKGLVGGSLFCLMYQEAYLVLGRLWGEEDFDTYLVAGVHGSIYLAAAGMAFLLTIIITINHFFISYATHGNPENVLFNRMAVVFKFAVYVILLIANSRLGFEPLLLWKNALQCLTDIAILLLIVSVESQFDTFKILHHEFRKEKEEQRG